MYKCKKQQVTVQFKKHKETMSSTIYKTYINYTKYNCDV